MISAAAAFDSLLGNLPFVFILFHTYTYTHKHVQQGELLFFFFTFSLLEANNLYFIWFLLFNHNRCLFHNPFCCNKQCGQWDFRLSGHSVKEELKRKQQKVYQTVSIWLSFFWQLEAATLYKKHSNWIRSPAAPGPFTPCIAAQQITYHTQICSHTHKMYVFTKWPLCIFQRIAKNIRK